MVITIIRHGKVNHTWKKSCTSAEFDEECRLYDIAPIEDMSCARTYKAQKVYISTLDRSYQTARQLFGEKEFAKTALINEVPLSSSFDTKIKLPLWFWNVTGRLQWFYNSKRQIETRKQTRKRAEEFVQELLHSNEDCAIVTHGFFMHTLISVMKKHGFKGDNTSMNYKNGEVMTLVK
jgi:broad specificity phosphatase PhoE